MCQASAQATVATKNCKTPVHHAKNSITGDLLIYRYHESELETLRMAIFLIFKTSEFSPCFSLFLLVCVKHTWDLAHFFKPREPTYQLRELKKISDIPTFTCLLGLG